jgi:hypothetical protein
MKSVLLTNWLLTLSLLMLCMTAQAQHAPGTHGRNVTQIIYSNGSQALGRFEQTGVNQWIEYSDHNNSQFNFIERSRDDWSVYLFDASRDVAIQLDLHRKKVIYSQGNLAAVDIYNISGSRNNAYVKNRNDRHRHNTPPPAAVSLLRDSASYTLADNSIMVLERRGPSNWIEYSPQDNEIYQYNEVGRSGSSIYLFDAASNIQAEIHFKQNIVVFTRAEGPDPKYFYALRAPEQHQANQYQPGQYRKRDHNNGNRYRHRRDNQQQYVQPAPPPPAQISGYTISRVVFGEGKKPLGEFVKSGARSWTQYIKHSGVTYHFEEQRRDQYTVYLYDTAHAAHVQLDLRNNKVTYGEEFKLKFDKYDILRSEL